MDFIIESPYTTYIVSFKTMCLKCKDRYRRQKNKISYGKVDENYFIEILEAVVKFNEWKSFAGVNRHSLTDSKQHANSKTKQSLPTYFSCMMYKMTHFQRMSNNSPAYRRIITNCAQYCFLHCRNSAISHRTRSITRSTRAQFRMKMWWMQQNRSV